MTKKEILLTLIDHYGKGSKANMARFLGVTPQAISTWLIRNSFDIELLYAKCEGINPAWLLNGGQGPMLLHTPAPANPEPAPNEGQLIPLYNAEASAGTGLLRLEKEYVVNHIRIPFAQPGDIALISVGNSMQPEINSGDILVVRQRANWHEYLETNKMYVIVTDDEIFVKVVSAVNADHSFTLHSYNPAYSDFRVPAPFIRSVFKVVGVISHKSY